MSPPPSLTGLVLAAGTSSRMGAANKLLLTLDGAPLVVHAVRSLRAGGVRDVVVVTGHERDRVEQAVAEHLAEADEKRVEPHDGSGGGVRCVHNPRFASGMASSLVVGVEAALGADGWLIHLGDVPRVAAATVRRLRARFAEATRPVILLPTHGGRRGHPVVFDAAFGDALTRLTGDAGARPVVQAHPDAVVEVPVDDPGIHRDVDTPDRYDAMRDADG